MHLIFFKPKRKKQIKIDTNLLRKMDKKDEEGNTRKKTSTQNLNANRNSNDTFDRDSFNCVGWESYEVN